jgi:hypothetical protein
MIPGMTAPSLVAMCHPKRHRIKRQIAHFHKINSHFAKVQLSRKGAKTQRNTSPEATKEWF